MKEDFLRLVEEAALETLTSRERNMLFRYYGVGGYDPMTLEKIGKSMRISNERARQIIDKSVKKITERSQYKTVIDQPSVCQQLGAYLNQHVGDGRTSLDAARAILESGLLVLDEPLEQPLLALILTGIRLKDAKKAISKVREEAQATEKRLQSQGRIDLIFEGILRAIEWPLITINAREQFGKVIGQTRKTNQNEKGLYEFFDSKKAGRAIYYDSKLELSFYELLEMASQVEYYAEQPFPIKYGDEMTLKYFPDVYVLLKDGRGIIFEIKPSFLMPLANNLRKFRALKEFCEKEGLGYSMTDMRAIFAELRRTKVRSEYKTAVLNAIERQPISWPEYIKIKDAFEPSKEEFIALVVQNELVWRQEPFKLGNQR